MTAKKDETNKHDKELNIHQRLYGVMGDVSYIQKEAKKVNNQYKFAGHDAVTKASREAFLKWGVLCLPQNIKRVIDGNRTEMDMNLMFINIDKPDDFVKVPTAGYGIDSQDKGVGKAYSYAVKYGLLKALSLETGDDPERDNVDHEPQIAVDYEKQKKAYAPTRKVMKDLMTDLCMCDEETSFQDMRERANAVWKDLDDRDRASLTDQMESTTQRLAAIASGAPLET